MNQRLIIFILLGIILIMAVWGGTEWSERDRAHEIELKRSGEALKKKDREIRLLLDSLHKQDLAAIKALQEATIRADRAEAAAQKAIRNYEKIRLVRATNDFERDSILARILQD